MRLVVLLFCLVFYKNVNCLGHKELSCPQLCTCRLEHITETAIHHFMQQNKEEDKQAIPEVSILENNDIFYEEEFNEYDGNSFVRSATCIVQTESTTEELINELPKEIQSVTLIQASDSGNKTIKFSYFSKFPELKIIELQSAQKLTRNVTSHFLCEVDVPLQQLEYLNLERVFLKNSKKRYDILENEFNEDVVTFEYVQKIEGNSHPLTFIQRGTNNKILPYKAYIENHKNEEVPLFIGFTNLILLRIYECELNNIHWEMFDGLSNLNNLILEKNKLRFIPDFAFYGIPNLKSLSLAWNDLLNIQITDLAGLLELEYLDLSHNNFSQLSELSLPPFPKLKLANFANNPITVVFPNTFEVMNTTDSLILGGLDEPLSLLANSFIGLKLLKTLTLLELKIPILKQELLIGMPTLRTLVMTGSIPEIQYDAFSEVSSLDTLKLSKCNITKLSIDSFVGLYNLRVLDLSKNNLYFLPPGSFDELLNIKELYLNENKFRSLPKEIFMKLHPRLIRLNENAWHCSCDMSDWKPMLINRIKQKSIKACDATHDKGVGCTYKNTVYYKFVYENRVAPKCTTPKKYENWSIFHVMRKQLKCTDFKPKIKKRIGMRLRNNSSLTMKTTTEEIDWSTNVENLKSEISTENYSQNYSTENLDNLKLRKLKRRLNRKIKFKKTLYLANESNNISNNISTNISSSNLNSFESYQSNRIERENSQKSNMKFRKFKKI